MLTQMEEKARKTYFDFDEYIRQGEPEAAESAKQIGVSTTTIDKHIRQMRDTLIRHVGPKKGGHWEIIAD